MGYIRDMLRMNKERLSKLNRYADLNPQIKGAADELSYQIKLLEYSMIMQARHSPNRDFLTEIDIEKSKNVIVNADIFEDEVFNKVR